MTTTAISIMDDSTLEHVDGGVNQTVDNVTLVIGIGVCFGPVGACLACGLVLGYFIARR